MKASFNIIEERTILFALNNRLCAAAIVAIGLSCLVCTPVLAVGQTGHHEAVSAPAKKYETDPILRDGMKNISDLVRARWDAAVRSKLPSAEYVRLATEVGKQVTAVVNNCTLPAASDRAFHEILMDMNHALNLMRSSKIEVQRAGVFALGQALDNYGRYFDHPGWPQRD